MNPIERNLARVLIQLRQASYIHHNTSSDDSSDEEYREFTSDYDQEHFRDLMREKVNIENWNKELENGFIDAPLIDNLVLDYLIKSGMKEAAVKFMAESDISAEDKLESKVHNLREEIVILLTDGFVDQTIIRLNQVNPCMLKNDRELWLEILTYKLDGKLREIKSFANLDVVTILESCDTEPEKQKIVGMFEDIASSLIIDGNFPFELDSTIKKISKRILEHFDINSSSNIEELLKLTYITQDKMKGQYDLPKLTSKRFSDNTNIISD